MLRRLWVDRTKKKGGVVTVEEALVRQIWKISGSRSWQIGEADSVLSLMRFDDDFCVNHGRSRGIDEVGSNCRPRRIYSGWNREWWFSSDCIVQRGLLQWGRSCVVSPENKGRRERIRRGKELLWLRCGDG